MFAKLYVLVGALLLASYAVAEARGVVFFGTDAPSAPSVGGAGGVRGRGGGGFFFIGGGK